MRTNNILLDYTAKQVFIEGKSILFTKIEYDIFIFLYKKQGKVYSREELVKQIWNDEYVSVRTVDVNITRMRKKMGVYGKNIVTRSGYGYYFDIKV